MECKRATAGDLADLHDEIQSLCADLRAFAKRLERTCPICRDLQPASCPGCSEAEEERL
jgi:hypothetical protein